MMSFIDEDLEFQLEREKAQYFELADRYNALEEEFKKLQARLAGIIAKGDNANAMVERDAIVSFIKHYENCVKLESTKYALNSIAETIRLGMHLGPE